MGFFDGFIDGMFDLVEVSAKLVCTGIEEVGSTLETIGDSIVYQEPSRLWELVPTLPKVPGILGSFIDNVLRDRVDEPAIGSLVYCDLLMAEHSGIYIGDGQIVHLDGDGTICMVSHQEFLDRLDGLNTAISIYVSCVADGPVGDAQAARRALDMVGRTRNYNMLLDNCHQFSAGCLTGDFENAVNFFLLLERLARSELGMDNWRVWNE
jgi:hypothetical protein